MKSEPPARPVIGVDFDNTIADYDDLMHSLAVERGLVGPDFPRNKKLIRDAIRSLPDGEKKWRSLQVTAYGPRMSEARLIEGVEDFFTECRRRRIPVFIVSHKTEYANFGEQDVNLRQAALEWLGQQGFFDGGGIGLSREAVFFEATRDEKIARIRALGATHFIDDLEETFAESAFPAGVRKILFSTHGQPPSVENDLAATSWKEIHEHVLSGHERATIGHLLGREVSGISRIGRGGNSKVYRVDCADGSRFAAKLYFQRTIDGLDRMQVEFASLDFISRSGRARVPRPIIADTESQIALYEFIDGTPVDAANMLPGDVEEAVSFAASLKKMSRAAGAAALPKAAEAVFSFAELETNLSGRLERLEAGVVASDLAESSVAFQNFLAEELRPALDEMLDHARSVVGNERWARELPPASRTLSPSDFGFHNALRGADGGLVFLDFEYFGWDDPAKMIADFILHPAMQLGDAEKAAYVDSMLSCFSDDAELSDRFALMHPLFGFKWCLIMLNEFIPDFLDRRAFATRRTDDREAIRFRQLEKSRSLLGRLRSATPSP